KRVPVRLSIGRVAVTAGLMLAASASTFAQGGPPLITDDPDTPGPRHWEINLSMFRERTSHERVTEEPRLDLNYGVGRRIQLKLEAPWIGMTTANGRANGLGDATAGVKWRRPRPAPPPHAASVDPPARV